MLPHGRRKAMSQALKKHLKTIPIGILAAVILSVALVALIAFLIQKQTLGFEIIPILNPIIKSLCALTAALVGTAALEKMNWLFGALCGLGYIVITTLAFALLSGGLNIGSANLIDALMCAFAGMIGGIIRSLSR